MHLRPASQDVDGPAFLRPGISEGFDPGWLDVKSSAISMWISRNVSTGRIARRRREFFGRMLAHFTAHRGCRPLITELPEGVVPYMFPLWVDDLSTVFPVLEDRAVPIDDHDHGTHTTGTMIGDDGGSNLTGVAPGAKWIGCRNMNAGNGQPSTYIACMEYFLAPWPHGGDPETDGRPEYSPHIINNSWGCPPSEGCDAGTLLDASRSSRS